MWFARIIRRSDITAMDLISEIRSAPSTTVLTRLPSSTLHKSTQRVHSFAGPFAPRKQRDERAPRRYGCRGKL
jgi:hypothetical protein